MSLKVEEKGILLAHKDAFHRLPTSGFLLTACRAHTELCSWLKSSAELCPNQNLMVVGVLFTCGFSAWGVGEHCTQM